MWFPINAYGYIPPAFPELRGVGCYNPPPIRNLIFVRLNWTESAYGWRGVRNGGNGDTVARAFFDDGCWNLEILSSTKMLFRPLSSEAEAFRLAEMYFAPVNNPGV